LLLLLLTGLRLVRMKLNRTSPAGEREMVEIRFSGGNMVMEIVKIERGFEEGGIKVEPFSLGFIRLARHNRGKAESGYVVDA
jgi:hypothetical protein